MLYQVACLVNWIGCRVDPIVAWVKQGAYVWLTLQVVGSVVAISYVVLPGDSSSRLAAAGMLLQVIGIWTVAYGLGRSRKLFDRRSLWQEFIAWMSNLKRVFTGPSSVYLSVNSATSSASAGRVRVRIGWPSSEASVEEKIRDLQGRIERLQDALDYQKEVLEDRIERETKERDRLIEESEKRTKEQIAEVSIGGLHIEAAGLFFLACGVVLGTVPGYVVGLFVK